MLNYYRDFKSVYAATPSGNMHYLHHPGKSRGIIFIHGLGASTMTWIRLMGQMPEDADVYLVDLIGHGRSDAPELDYSAGVQKMAIEALARESEIEAPFLFGHSYGGWIASLFALNNQVSGIVLEDAAGLREFYNEMKIDEDRESYKSDMIRKAEELDANPHVVRSILNDEAYEDALDAATLGKIKAPTLIIWGENDNVVSLRYGRMFYENIKGSRLEVIRGAKHTPHYTNPGEVGSLLANFLYH